MLASRMLADPEASERSVHLPPKNGLCFGIQIAVAPRFLFEQRLR